jgi:CheY-like chemotaxis protein
LANESRDLLQGSFQERWHDKMAGETVLIIDDSAELRTSLEAILVYGGYQPISAGTGEEGLTLASEMHPDVILIDLELPDTTGLKLLGEFNLHGLSIPTVMMTGYGSEGTAARALRLGVRDYLIKPFTTEEVLSSIERALEEVRLRRENERLLALVENYTRCLDQFGVIGSMLRSGLDLRDVLQRIVEVGLLTAGADEGSILLLDEAEEQLHVAAAWGQPEETARAISSLIGDERLRLVLEEGRAVRLHAEAGDSIETQAGGFAAALLQVPLRTQGHVLGLMTLERREDSAPFSLLDEQILTILADYAVVALGKADLSLHSTGLQDEA